MDSGSLSAADLHNLMACVCNGTLQQDVRCNAAGQLRAVVSLEHCRAAIAVPSFLEVCLRQVERAVGIEHETLPGAESAGPQAHAAPLSVFQMQLPIACLQLLSALCICSDGVLVRS